MLWIEQAINIFVAQYNTAPFKAIHTYLTIFIHKYVYNNIKIATQKTHDFQLQQIKTMQSFLVEG